MQRKIKDQSTSFLSCILLLIGTFFFITSCITHDEKIRIALDQFKETTGDHDLQGLSERLSGVNNDIRKKGIVFDSLSMKELLTGYDYGQFYDWDLYFECIYQLYNGESKYCFSNLEAFLIRQEDDGFIKRSFGPYNYGEMHMFKPFIAQTALLGMRQTPKIDWLVDYYPKIVKYENCWYERYDKDKNNLCVWYNADHSGMDNQNSRVINGLIDEGVDLNCYLYREFCALSELANILGKKEDKALFDQKAEMVKKAINELLWDEETGFYYDRLENTGKLNKVKGISGFTPLYAGIVPQNRAERMVKEHLLNEKEFWAKYPINTLAQNEAGYDQSGAQPPSGHCNWNGTTWIPFNYMIFHGLLEYGYNDIAKELAYKTFDLVYRQNQFTREYYNSDTGEGYGRNPFYGWSTLAYFMPLEYELKYNPTKIEKIKILPLATILLELNTKNISQK